MEEIPSRKSLGEFLRSRRERPLPDGQQAGIRHKGLGSQKTNHDRTLSCGLRTLPE